MSRDTTASSKPFFMALSRMGDVEVSRGNSGRTRSKSGLPCSYRNCLRKPPAEKSGRGSLLNRPSSPSDDPTGQRTELNWIEFNDIDWIRQSNLVGHVSTNEIKLWTSSVTVGKWLKERVYWSMWNMLIRSFQPHLIPVSITKVVSTT